MRGPWTRRTYLAKGQGERAIQCDREGRGGRGDAPDVEEADDAEDPEAPLVRALDERADEATDDHEHAHEERGRDVREREAGREEHGEQEQREGDEPLDVADILFKNKVSKDHIIEVCVIETYPDLTSGVAAVAAELNGDGGRTEVRGDREVRDGRDSQRDQSQLVEHPCALRSLQVAARQRRVYHGELSIRTIMLRITMPRKDTPNTENAAHIQSEPLTDMWRSAFGGLRSSALLVILG